MEVFLYGLYDLERDREEADRDLDERVFERDFLHEGERDLDRDLDLDRENDLDLELGPLGPICRERLLWNGDDLPRGFRATSAYNIFKFCLTLSAYRGLAAVGGFSSSSPPKEVINSIFSPVSGEGLLLGD